jgi:hypothetical protein
MVKSVDISEMRQYRAKQEANKLLGACREHEPSAKAKMCSELHGDMKRLAEMTNPVERLVTESNTKYIHWRPHARRNMVPLDPDRFSINQDARTLH